MTVEGYVFRTGVLSGRDVVIGRSGAGKVNAAIVATLMLSHFKPAAVFFSGTAVVAAIIRGLEREAR